MEESHPMTVAELIEALKAMPQDAKVVVFDNEFAANLEVHALKDNEDCYGKPAIRLACWIGDDD